MDVNADTRLVGLLQRDDVAAFDTLYWKYHRPVHANILKLVKNEEAAQDLLQEVFVALWQKRQSLDETQPVANWLFVVSYNKAVSYLKKTLRETIIRNELSAGKPTPDDDEINLREVRFQLLEAAIAQLSSRKRSVFELCKLQGKTYEEAAKELNLSRHTVKEYLSDAMATIYEYLTKHSPTLLYILLSGLFYR